MMGKRTSAVPIRVLSVIVARVNLWQVRSVLIFCFRSFKLLVYTRSVNRNLKIPLQIDDVGLC